MADIFHKKGREYGYIERDAKIKLMGKEFESGGAFFAKRRKDNLMGGIVYAYPKEGKIGNWIGTWKVPAHFGHEWLSNMGDTRQNITFHVGNKGFTGTYFKSGSEIIRVKELKKKLRKVV